MLLIELFSSNLFDSGFLHTLEIDENSWLSPNTVILACVAFLSIFILLEWRKRNQASPKSVTIVPWKKLSQFRIAVTSVTIGSISVVVWLFAVYFSGGWRLEFFAIFVSLSCSLGAIWSGGSRSPQSLKIVQATSLILIVIGSSITFLWQFLPTSVHPSEFDSLWVDHGISMVFICLFTFIGLVWAHEAVMSSTPSTYSLHDFLGYLVPTVTYSLSGLVKHKKRSMNIVIIILLSVAMVTSLAIWIDEAPEVAIQRALDERDYHFYVQRRGYATGVAGDPEILHRIGDYLLENETLIEDVELVFNTIALFNIKNKSNSYDMSYLLTLAYNKSLDQVYATRVSPNQQAQLVSEPFMEKIRRQFRVVEGNYEFGDNNVLMSRRLQSHINESIGLDIHAGDIVNISLARNDLDPENPPFGTLLGYYHRLDFYNVRIAAIVERIPVRRLSFTTFNIETLGDCLYIPKSLTYNASHINYTGNYLRELETGYYEATFALVIPRLFVRLDKETVSKLTWRNLEDEILALEKRIRAYQTAQWFAAVFFEMDEVYYTINLYKQTRWVIVFLLVPIVTLSVLLVFATTGVLNRSRFSELKVLKCRGADLLQVVGSVLLEMTILAFIGVRIGIFAGQYLAATIPATKRFLEPDISDLPELRDLLVLPSQSWTNTVILFGLILLVGLMIQSYFQIRNIIAYPNSEGHKERINPVFAYISDHNIDLIVLLVGFPGLFWLVDSDILGRTFSDQEFLALHLTLAVLLWLGFAAISSRVMTLVIAKAEGLLTKIFSASAFVIVTNLKRRQHLISILAFVATVTFSIGIFASIYNETIWRNTDAQMKFLIGSDYKILTDTSPWSMSDNFTSIAGISEAMPLTLTAGEIGDSFVAILGVNASQYARIANWDSSAFDDERNRVEYFGDSPYYSPNGQRRDVRKILEDLENTPNGIIVNEELASDLRMDIGDYITLANAIPGGSEDDDDLIIQIVGIGFSAPGIGILSSFYERPIGTSAIGSLGAAIVNNYALAQLGLSEARAFLLKADSNTNQDNVVSQIRKFSNVRAVYYSDHYNIEEEGFLALGGVPGILTIDFIGSLAIVGFALGVFLEFIISERRQEYALLRAVGATRGQVSKSVVGEFLGIGVIALFIGGIVSVIFSLAFLELSVGHLAIFSILPYTVFIPIPTALLTIILVFSFLMIGALWPSRSASQMRIADVLRNL